MQKYIKIPYGIANFEKMATGDYYYVDRTNFIEKMEALGESHISFLRPRRFGKSLFVSMLKYYYDIRHSAKFDTIFAKYYIGKNPTPLKNSYFILSFDFSGILTDTEEKAHEGFLNKVKNSAINFFHDYFPDFLAEMKPEIEQAKEANEVLLLLFNHAEIKDNSRKIYLIIDEYDHFANELITWDLQLFMKVVSMNGWVRKFYEVIKTATGDGIVDRIFVTGVSPITLDSLTSGFNIMKMMGGRIDLHQMMGFTSEEVKNILLGVGVNPENLDSVLQDVKDWYNGYLFTENLTIERLYNPDMVLYFASEYVVEQKYPAEMLDINVMTDYGKIRRQFQIDNGEEKRLRILEELIQNGEVEMKRTSQFSFTSGFTDRDFVSLLYYTGVVTIKNMHFDKTIFQIPNYVIKQLYFDYFGQILAEKTHLTQDALGYGKAIDAMLSHNDFLPMVGIVSKIMEQLSNRDNMQFSEKHLKSIFMAFLMTSEAYYVHSELEINKMYIDLFIERTSRFNIPFQYLIEFKYFSKTEYETLVKKSRSKKQPPKKMWAEVVQEARNQLDGYKNSDFFLQKTDLVSWLIIFVGHEAKVVEMQT